MQFAVFVFQIAHQLRNIRRPPGLVKCGWKLPEYQALNRTTFAPCSPLK